MRRFRDNVYSNSQLNRPIELYGQPHVPGDERVGELAGGVAVGGGAAGAGGGGCAQKLSTNGSTLYLKDLLALIRDVSTEKSQGERRVVNLKQQIQELESELDSVNLELEEAKRLKECTEQKLKGYEVELAMNESSIQILEGRISLIQEEISTVGSDLESLKNEEGALRDDFIGKMFDLNATIRKFQRMVDSAMFEAYGNETMSQDGLCSSSVDTVHDNTREAEEAKRDLEEELAQMISKTNKEEEELQSEQGIRMQEQKELDDLKHRISLMEAVMEGSKELQELAMQTSRLEEACSSFGDKLQKRCICPSCQHDNVGMLGGILQKNSGI